MSIGRLRAAILALVLAAGAAAADDLSEFNAGVEAAASHNRVAAGYLRTGNVDLAAVELERMRDAWVAVVSRFGNRPPAALRDNALYAGTLTGVSVRIAAALRMVDNGRIEAARASLREIRNSLAAMRRASGIEVLADCVLDANGAMDALFAFRDSPPDWTKPAAGADVTARAEAYAGLLRRCDRIAPAALRVDPEFRRLVDGALGSLAEVPKAVSARDGDRLFRLLIELRSFDHLLAFRFG